MGLGGFEPPTSPLSGVRSNQLSYRPGRLGHVFQEQTIRVGAVLAHRVGSLLSLTAATTTNAFQFVYSESELDHSPKLHK